MRSLIAWLVALPILSALGLAAAQPPAATDAEPWRPAAYRARVYFRIDADRTERHRQFQALVKRLSTAAGFKKDKGFDNEEFFADTISGLVPGKTAGKLMVDDHVRTVLLVPEGHELPAEADKPVLVRLELLGTFGTQRQREIADKTRKLLNDAKFQEAVGYDHRNHERLMGWLPVVQLDAILKQGMQIDMAVPATRGLPSDPGPASVRVSPVQQIIVLREPRGAEPLKEPAAPPPPEKPHFEKISADLRKFTTGLEGDVALRPIQVEVVLRVTPAVGDDSWRAPLVANGVAPDGRIGQLVSAASLIPARIADVAELAEVSTVRLPQWARAPALAPFDPAKPGLDVDFVALRRSQSVVGPLAALVRRHEPLRVAVLAGDFRGYRALVGKQLPKNITLLDMTGERNADIVAAPVSGDANEVGLGTRLAVLLHAAAPAEEMLLVRLDPAAPYQVEEAARSISAGRWGSEALARRQLEIRNEKSRLDEEKLDLRVQRQLALNNFGDDKDSKEAREKYRKRQAEFDVTERIFNEKVGRYLQFQRNVARLKRLSTVLVSLHWPDGHAHLAGDRPGLRTIDADLLQSAAWIQAIPRTPAQSWSGLLRDANNDAALEFVPAQPHPASRSDLNFLAWKPHAWQPAGGKVLVPELPAKVVVELTLQWREIHSAAWKTRAGEDVYRKPLTPFRIVVLRQRDPQGKELPTDAFEVVERSAGLPDRIENDDRTAVYQITARFQVGEQPGRYAVRVEGVQPDSTLPAEAARLPSAERFEVHPKLTVDVVDPAHRPTGRVIFQSHSTAE